MKLLSLKLDDKIFNETEEIISQLNMARNRYINDAVHLYNTFNKRKMLKKKLVKESKIVMRDSLNVLHEYEKLVDEN
ncbi:MAG: hypothetical protein LBE82_05550 [Chitinophagaceae bacterium]|jgi:hypothetical protein|nr:hypothetical protein [Chitinophagaceae bacterium]